MKLIIILCLLVGVFFVNLYSENVQLDNNFKSIYEVDLETLNGNSISLSEFKNKVILVVNVASYCGLTSQYTKLQKLYELYNNEGLEIIAFPCNQFGNQEPGSSNQIKMFCETKFKTTFLMSKKVDVNGDSQHDLYKYFKSIDNGSVNKRISWNFTKFLIDRNGNVIDRFGPITSPLSKNIRKSIEIALNN